MSYQAMSLFEFAHRFSTHTACVDAIIARRWPSGWKCPNCDGMAHYRLRTRRALQCARRSCRAQVSVTRGTVFGQLKIPLPKVFLAIYLMTDKQGISAMCLSKHLAVAYNTAFDLLRKLRRAMADRDAGYTLAGVVQVDESYVGGHGDGNHRRGRARDTKRLLGVAVERRGPNQSGFIHLEPLPAANAESLHGLILEKIKTGAHLLTDQWAGYRGIARKGYDHEPVTSPGGKAACSIWPLVHRAASNFTSWLHGTHHNYCLKYLADYAAEFCWRTNRRNMSKRDYDTNRREILLPDRLLTLACTARYHATAQLREAA